MAPKYLDANFSRNKHFNPREKCDDLADAPTDATELQINRATKNLSRLASFRKLKKLSVSSMKVDCLEEVARLKSLQILAVGYSSYDDLSALRGMTNLKCLLLSNLKKVSSVDFLRDLTGLKALEIADMKKVVDLSPLSALTNLEELQIDSGGMTGKQMTVDSLKPIGDLAKLKYLWLYAMTEEMSLEPLSRLSNLKSLGINGHYPWQEYAKLSAYLPKTECDWLGRKYIEWGYPSCRKCSAARAIKPPGKGKKAFCGDCYPEKIDQLVAEYDQQFAIGKAGKW